MDSSSTSSKVETVNRVANVATGADVALRRRENSYSRLITQYRSYVWLVNWAWDIELCRSYNGWTFNLRTYGILPLTSHASQLIRHGDTSGLEQLLITGGVRPNNCIVGKHGGLTNLLQVSLRSYTKRRLLC